MIHLRGGSKFYDFARAMGSGDPGRARLATIGCPILGVIADLEYARIPYGLEQSCLDSNRGVAFFVVTVTPAPAQG